MTEPAFPLFHLTEKVVILTGASSGLGRRFARVLHGAGADLVVAARRAERLEELATELRADRGPSAGGRIATVAIDVTEPGAPGRLIDEAVSNFGAVDVVVNNAGVSRVLPAVDDTRDGFVDELTINLVAPYEIARTAARWMIENERSGAIVNVGSVMGLGGGGRLRAAGYAASKGGLHNLTRELASQWARKGIRVNALAPGWFASEMTDDMFGTEAGRSYIESNTPLGRPGASHELDGALLFLASGASSYVTGHVLAVDGGWSAI
ncbi:MAG: SDR family oxidoreductase [Acidimicrobiia bacterium]|nr:SDR family oxidoreductase [Acidimicrobiia bacterium]